MRTSMDDLAGLRLVVAGGDLSAVQPVRDRLAAQGAEVRALVGDLEEVARAIAADPPEAIVVDAAGEAALRARLDPLALDAGPAVITAENANAVRAIVELRRLKARQTELEAVFAAASVARAREAERAEHDTLQRLLQAAGYRDDNTYEHTQRVGLLAAKLARELGLLRPRRRADRPRRAAARHRQDRDPGLDPAQARAADRGGVRGRQDPRGARRAGAGGRRVGPVRGGRVDRPPPPRALGRRRLPARPRGRGDPRRRADRARRRRLRRARARAALPRIADARGGRRGDPARGGHATSIRRLSRSSKSSHCRSEPGLPITRGVSPRIRTFVLLLVFASALAVPASASANWATLFAAPTHVRRRPWSLLVRRDRRHDEHRADRLGRTPTSTSRWRARASTTSSGSSTAARPRPPARRTSPATARGPSPTAPPRPPGGPFTPWVDDIVHIDKTVAGQQHDDVDRLAHRPGHACRSPASPATAARRCTASGRSTARLLDHRSPTPLRCPARARTRFTRRVVDAAGNRDDRSQHRQRRQHAPGRQHDRSRSASRRLRGHHAHRRRRGRPVRRRRASSTSSTAAPRRPSPTATCSHITANGTHSLQTKVVDNVGNESGWKTQHRAGRLRRPGRRHHRRPERLGHAPRRRSTSSIAATDTSGSGVTRSSGRSPRTSRSGDRRRRRPGARHRQRRGHAHAAHPLHRRARPRLAVVLAPRSGSTRPCRSTRRRPRPRGCRRRSLDVTVHGTDARARLRRRLGRVEDRRRRRTPRSATPARRPSPAAASTRSRRASSTSPATLPPWVSRIVRLDTTAPRNTTPAAPGGWRTGRLLRAAQRRATTTPASPRVQWRVNGGAVQRGRPGRRDRDGQRRRRPHARDPRPRRRRQLLRLARPRRSASTRSSRPTRPSSRAHRSATATRSRSPGTDALSGIGGQ